MNYQPGLELLRWGIVQIPAVLYFYAQELNLDIEDLGLLGAVFYAFTNRSKPLYRTGLEIGQIIQVCPGVTRQRLSKRINKWVKTGLVYIDTQENVEFSARKIYLDPLMQRLNEIIIRDHPEFKPVKTDGNGYRHTSNERRVEQLELALYDEKINQLVVEVRPVNGQEFKKVTDFIARRTGNLISLKMAREVRKWLEEYGFKAEFIQCMLELCFERGITQHREISRIGKGLKEYSVNNLEGMEKYFKTFVDGKKINAVPEFDPEVIEFGAFTGIDMNAEARRKIYYKWRYDWGFTPEMIKKAGEIMCSHTRTGGLEYIDSILNSWLEKRLRSVEDVEKEIEQQKKQRRKKAETYAPGKESKRSDKVNREELEEEDEYAGFFR